MCVLLLFTGEFKDVNYLYGRVRKTSEKVNLKESRI